MDKFTVNAKNLLVILTLLLTTVHATSIDAQNWLVNHQGANGDFNNAFFSGDASAALTALPLTDKNLTANYLNSELNNFASFSTWGDAQSASYAIAAMHGNSFTIDNETEIINKLLTFRDNTTGGFIGWYEAPAFNQVTSAPDTALALIALKTTNTLNPVELTQSLNYLLSLQNPDGSYNLTTNTESSALAAFTPTKQSTTALVLLALAINGLNESNTPQITQSLNYLENQVQCQSPITQNPNALALTAATLNAYSKQQSAQFAAYYLQQNQQPDGGFFEPARGSNNENPIDTALASIELNETTPLNPCQTNTTLVQIQNTTNLYARDYANFEITLQNNASDENITVKLYNNGALQQTQTTQIQANTNTTLILQTLITYGQNQITAQLQNQTINQNYNVNVIRLNAPTGTTTFELPEIKTNLTISTTNDTQLTLTPTVEPIFGALNATTNYSINILTITTNTTVQQTTLTITPTAQEITAYDLTTGNIYQLLTDTPYVLHASTILPNNTDYNDLTNRCNFFAVAMRISGINYSHINPADSPFSNPVPEYCLSELAAAADLNILRLGEGLNNTPPRGNWTVSANGIVRNAGAGWLYRITRLMQNGWGAQLYANWTANGAAINFSQTDDPLAYKLKLQAFYAYTTGGITNAITLPNGDLDICFECTPTLKDALQLIYYMLGEQNQATSLQQTWTALPTTLNSQTYTANVNLPAKFKLGWTITNGQNNNSNNNNNNPQGVHVIIDMPTGQDTDTYIQNCTNAQQCFTQAGATLIGTTYNIPCPSGNPTTQLFVHTVNGHYANFSINEAYWEFIYNQQSSSSGLSCQQTTNGDTIKLQVTDNQTNPQTPASSSSSSSSSGGSSGSTVVKTQTNNSNQTNKPLTTDSITRLNTEGFNAPQTTTPTQQTQNTQPSTSTGLFPAITDNPIAIIGIIALIIAGAAAYHYRKKPNTLAQ